MSNEIYTQTAFANRDFIRDKRRDIQKKTLHIQKEETQRDVKPLHHAFPLHSNSSVMWGGYD